MDLRFTPEQERFRRELRDWLDANLPRPWSQEVRNPQADADSLRQLPGLGRT